MSFASSTRTIGMSSGQSSSELGRAMCAPLDFRRPPVSMPAWAAATGTAAIRACMRPVSFVLPHLRNRWIASRKQSWNSMSARYTSAQCTNGMCMNFGCRAQRKCIQSMEASGFVASAGSLQCAMIRCGIVSMLAVAHLTCAAPAKASPSLINLSNYLFLRSKKGPATCALSWLVSAVSS